MPCVLCVMLFLGFRTRALLSVWLFLLFETRSASADASAQPHRFTGRAPVTAAHLELPVRSQLLQVLVAATGGSLGARWSERLRLPSPPAQCSARA